MHPVPRHDLYACEFPIGGSLSTVAVGMRHEEQPCRTKAGTPLQGANTNLAGVFELNTVAKSHGLMQTWNDWQVTSPGFFGTGRVTLTAYAVAGTAPALIDHPGQGAISNIVRLPFTIAG